MTASLRETFIIKRRNYAKSFIKRWPPPLRCFMKAYFFTAFCYAMIRPEFDKKWIFFKTQLKKKKQHPLITMPLVMLVTALQLHFQSCWRLSTVIPCHSIQSIQRSSNLIGIVLSSWGIINIYVLCAIGKWTFRISYFSFQSSYSSFSVKKGGGCC